MSAPVASLSVDPIAYWNGPAGARWAAQQDETDRLLAPLGDAALRVAAPAAGERVLDVGCGCGTQTLMLAAAVGASGSVVGVDVSSIMLSRARELARAHANVSYVEADASEFRPDEPVDLVFSRFGVMFFRDPLAAFTNLRACLRPGGRVVFVCWQGVERNPWLGLPLEAARTLVAIPEAPPDDPGPHAFADRARVGRILEAAGFAERSIEPWTGEVQLSNEGLDGAVRSALRSGAVGRVVSQLGESDQERVALAVRAVLSPYAASHRVELPAAAWIVTARPG